MGIKAAYFDGLTYIQNDVLPAIPSSSPYGFLFYWYNSTFAGTNSWQTMLENNDGSDNNSVWIVQRGGTGSSGGALEIALADNPDYDSYMERWGDIGGDEDFLPYDGNWHNVMISWNTQTGDCVAYLDNSAVNMTDPRSASYGTFDMGFNDYLWRVGLEDPSRTFPGVSPGYSSYVGSLAEMIFMTGFPVDITQASVRARIIDPDTLLPVPIDAAGYYLLGDSGSVPQIFLSGDETGFLKNYPNYTATCTSQADASPSNAFYVPSESSALQTASNDPFGNPMS